MAGRCRWAVQTRMRRKTGCRNNRSLSMTKRILTFCALGDGTLISAQSVLAQQRAGTAPAAQAAPAATATKAPYVPPKTAWGEPDLQGMWPLTHLISTNFQRSPNYGDRRFLTDEEFKAAQSAAAQRVERYQRLMEAEPHA